MKACGTRSHSNCQGKPDSVHTLIWNKPLSSPPLSPPHQKFPCNRSYQTVLSLYWLRQTIYLTRILIKSEKPSFNTVFWALYIFAISSKFSSFSCFIGSCYVCFSGNPIRLGFVPVKARRKEYIYPLSSSRQYFQDKR